MKHNMHRSRTLSTNQLHNTNGSNGEIEYQTFKEESHAKKQPPPHPPKQNKKTYKKHTQKKTSPTTYKQNTTNKTRKPQQKPPQTLTTTTCTQYFSDMYMYYRNCRLIVLLKFDVGDKPINIGTKEQSWINEKIISY